MNLYYFMYINAVLIFFKRITKLFNYVISEFKVTIRIKYGYHVRLKNLYNIFELSFKKLDIQIIF